MKKILLFAAVFAALMGCEKAPDGTNGGNGGNDGGSTSEKITVTPKNRTFAKEGGTCDVIVTSSGAWTLISPESASWLTPSIEEGNNGARVVFKADPNPSAQKRGPVVFTFKTGNKTAVFTAEQDGEKQVSDKFELLDPAQANIKVGVNGNDRIVVRISTEYEGSDITRIVTYHNGGRDWIESTQVSEFEGSMCSFLKIKPNEGDERRASIKFTAKGKEVVVDIVQEGNAPAPGPQPGGPTLEFENPSDSNLNLSKDQSVHQIYLDTNIDDKQLRLSFEYHDGEGWIYPAMHGEITAKSFGFVVFKNDSGAPRKATIVVTTLDGSNKELRMNITQQG